MVRVTARQRYTMMAVNSAHHHQQQQQTVCVEADDFLSSVVGLYDSCDDEPITPTSLLHGNYDAEYLGMGNYSSRTHQLPSSPADAEAVADVHDLPTQQSDVSSQLSVIYPWMKRRHLRRTGAGSTI